MYIDLQYVNLLFADIAGKLSVMDLFIIVTWWFGSRWTRAWLTSHCPSVLWHCWLGHISLTRKIVSEMTCNCVEWDVKPYYTIPYRSYICFYMLTVFQASRRASRVWWIVHRLVTWATMRMPVVIALPVKVLSAEIRRHSLPCTWQRWHWLSHRAQCRSVLVRAVVLLFLCALLLTIWPMAG